MRVGRTGVILIGMRRAGKSTVGAELAPVMGLPFVDLDREIERGSGRAAADILANDGEQQFRNKETEALLHVLSGPSVVLAAGGGTPLREQNRVAIGAFGRVLYLRVSADELVRRLGGDDDPDARPLLRGHDPVEDVRLLERERDPLYASWADEVIDAEGDAATVLHRCRVALGVD